MRDARRDVMTKENKQKKLPIDKAEYDKLVNLCLEIIRNRQLNILFITDLVAFLPISRATFYNYGLDKLDILKEEIDKNRIFTKQQLRLNWANSKSPGDVVVIEETEHSIIAISPMYDFDNVLQGYLLYF